MKIANSIFAAFVLLFLPPAAHALDPSQPVSSYIQTRFTTDNGLATNVVNQIVQSSDGFLWLLLGSGNLVRFDGAHFTTLPLVDQASSIAIGPNNDLWVLTTNGVMQIPAANLTQFGPLQALPYPFTMQPKPVPESMYFSRNGTLWVGTNGGLYRFDHGAYVPVTPRMNILRIEESANGNLWLMTPQEFMEWDGSRLITHPELSDQLGVKPGDILHVFEDSRGTTWYCTTNGVAHRSGNAIEKLEPWGPKHGTLRAYEDPQGTVWIAGAEGLFRATAGGLELAVPKMNVRRMYGDRDGNLWVGTNGEGLFRFKDRAVRMFTTADKLPSNVPMTVLTTHDGTLWAGFNCGGLARFDGQSFHIYNEKDGLLNSCVWSLAEDANHDLWIGTFGGGVFRFRNGAFTQFSRAQGLANDQVVAVVPTRDSSLWCATNMGVSRLRNGQVRTYTVADGLSTNLVLGIYEDRSGGIWIGNINGVDRLDGDRFVKVSSVPNTPTYVVGEDRSGAVYVSPFNGSVSRIDKDRLTAVIPNSEATYMIETPQGDVWLNGGGIWRITRSALEKPRGHDEPLDFKNFGIPDGLISREGSVGYPNAALTPDGKLWLATVEGLAMFDLPQLPKTDRKPVIYMEEMTIGRNQQAPGQQLVLAPGTSHVELRFDAVEITSPEKIHMQYRMDGVDSEWLDVEPPGRAIYSTIPPGTHAFHVRACNRDGIWDRTGMVYLIVQKPFFYQTTWFHLAVIATALLLVFALYRLRLRQATARLNASFDERLAERTRIARELHDTLLQTVQGSKLVADNALKKPDDVVHLLGAMKRLAGWLGQATQEGRAALNSLRTSAVETNDLAAALRRATEECQVNDSLEVKFSVTGSPRETHPIARDEIYRTAYEAIRNACEHSSATLLEVSLHYAHDLTLRVKDNGTGIDAAVVAEGKGGHFGLQGMRERAERIGSKLTIVSAPNAGTEVILIVPGSSAYRKLQSKFTNPR